MIWFLLYLTVAVLTIYPVAHSVAHDGTLGRTPDPADWIPAAFAGVMAAVIWPVPLIGFLAFAVSRRIWAGTWRPPWRNANHDREAAAEAGR